MFTHSKFSLGNTYSYFLAAKVKLSESMGLMKGHHQSPSLLAKAYGLCCEAISIIHRAHEQQDDEIITDFLLQANLHAMRVAANIAQHDQSITARLYQHAEFIIEKIPAATTFNDPARAIQSACALITLSQKNPKTKESETNLFLGCRNLNYHYTPKNLVQKSEALDEHHVTQLIFCLSQLIRTFRLKSRCNQAQLYAGMLMALLDKHLSAHWRELEEFLPPASFESLELNDMQEQLRQAAAKYAPTEVATLLTVEHDAFVLDCSHLQLLRLFQENICQYSMLSTSSNHAMMHLEQSSLLTNASVMSFTQGLFKRREEPRVFLLDDNWSPAEERTEMGSLTSTALQHQHRIDKNKNERAEETDQDKADRASAGDTIIKRQRH